MQLQNQTLGSITDFSGSDQYLTVIFIIGIVGIVCLFMAICMCCFMSMRKISICTNRTTDNIKKDSKDLENPRNHYTKDPTVTQTRESHEYHNVANKQKPKRTEKDSVEKSVAPATIEGILQSKKNKKEDEIQHPEIEIKRRQKVIGDSPREESNKKCYENTAGSNNSSKVYTDTSKLNLEVLDEVAGMQTLSDNKQSCCNLDVGADAIMDIRCSHRRTKEGFATDESLDFVNTSNPLPCLAKQQDKHPNVNKEVNVVVYEVVPESSTTFCKVEPDMSKCNLCVSNLVAGKRILSCNEALYTNQDDMGGDAIPENKYIHHCTNEEYVNDESRDYSNTPSPSPCLTKQEKHPYVSLRAEEHSGAPTFGNSDKDSTSSSSEKHTGKPESSTFDSDSSISEDETILKYLDAKINIDRLSSDVHITELDHGIRSKPESSDSSKVKSTENPTVIINSKKVNFIKIYYK